VAAPDLTATTVRYLFASDWAPPTESNWTLRVPGASVDGLDTAGSLLNLAIWSLRQQGLVDVEQLRQVETERVTVMGGHSFARLRVLEGDPVLAGLEGALLRKALEKPEALPGDDEDGVRGLVLALGLHDKAPWTSVAGYCFAEARDAGLVEVKGRMIRKPAITDPAAVEELAPRNAEIAAARTDYREQEPDLDGAVLSDCLAAVSWAHQS